MWRWKVDGERSDEGDNMSVLAVARGTRRLSPALEARLAGLLYLLIFLSAPSGAATATPLKMTLNLICDVGVALLFFKLLRPISRSLSLLASVCRLIFVVFMGVNALNYFGVTALFQQVHSPSAFDAGYGVALIPFGLHCLLTGYLIFNSTFLPRVLGILMMVAGCAYLLFLWPPLGSRLFFPWIVAPAVLGEASLTLWLLVMGVNAARWGQQERLLQPEDGEMPR